MTGGLKAAKKLSLSNLQSELRLGIQLLNKMNSQPLTGTQKKKNARGRREEEGGGGQQIKSS